MKTPFILFALASASSNSFAVTPAGKLLRTSYPAPPWVCARMEGLWEGQCEETLSRTYNARLQIFQDGCTDLALYDFDYPIPQIFRLGRENTTRSIDFMSTFSNITRYSEWSEDKSTFTSRLFFSSQYMPSDKLVTTAGEEVLSIALKDDVLHFESDLHSTNGSGPSFRTVCEYRKSQNP
jgi:hypothetical protein